ncbi:envelope integrity protein Cei [Parasphingorhabdus pacifica]
MAAATTRWGQRGPRYRRRRPLPALFVLCALVLASGFMWTQVFDSLEDIETATRCNHPSPPSTAPTAAGEEPAGEKPVALGSMLPRDALNETSPIPPQDIPVRVLNGNGESNEASLVSEQLTDLGFVEGAEAADDPVYTNYDLNCHGQIRFGKDGAEAARTLSLVVPCAQLVRDERNDPGVDLVLGAEFDDIRTTSEAKQVLQELKNWVPQRDREGSAAQEATPPRIGDDLMQKARDVHC